MATAKHKRLRRTAPRGSAPAGRKSAAGNAATRRRWSGEVTAHSNALDLDPGVFRRQDPRGIARSLKRSAERSHRRHSEPFRSAMSMLNFYINRAGKTLQPAQRQRLEAAKQELRALYGRAPH